MSSSCGGCKYSVLVKAVPVMMAEKTIYADFWECRRFPKKEDVSEAYYCGEFDSNESEEQDS